MHLLLSLPVWLSVVRPVLAQEPPAPPPTTRASGEAGVKRRRDHLMQVNFRSRMLSVPDSFLDFWFYDDDDEGANPYKRPSARGYVLGLEYVVNPNPANWIFYVEYIGNRMGEGYWDDVEDEAEHDDGDWIMPKDFGIWALGANAMHQIDLVKPDGGSAAGLGLQLLMGGGVGFGFVTGELVQWNPGGPNATDPECGPNAPAYDRRYSCVDDGAKRVPGVVPVADITFALRLNFGDRGNLRLEGGVHDLVYYGMAGGVVF